MSNLIIQRPGGLIGRVTDLKILIDGKEYGFIERRQTKEFEMTEGRHTLKIEYGWLIKKSKQVEFDLPPDKIFQIRFNPVYIWVIIYFMVAIILKGTSFDDGTWLIPRFGGQFQLLLMFLPGILGLIYWSLANKTLRLTESKELNLSLL